MGIRMGNCAWAVMALATLCSCSSYRSEQFYQQITTPQLGAVVQQDRQWLQSKTTPIGQLKLQDPLPVTVTELPFLASQRSPKDSTALAGDSLAKPQHFLRLALTDRVALIGLLNAPENRALCEYITQDADHAMTTTVDVYIDAALPPGLTSADQVFLAYEQGKALLLMRHQEAESRLPLEALSIFSSQQLQFCWAEDHSRTKQVVGLTENGRACPKGTHKKARKAVREREYLKF